MTDDGPVPVVEARHPMPPFDAALPHAAGRR